MQERRQELLDVTEFKAKNMMMAETQITSQRKKMQTRKSLEQPGPTFSFARTNIVLPLDPKAK
jgi:hypothetical protein